MEATVPPVIDAELQLETDRTSHLSVVIPPGVEIPERLRLRSAAGDGTREEFETGVLLRWSGIEVASALTILTEGQRDSPVPFNVRIVMAPGAAFDDMWEVQYTLAQGGIRRVRFVSGSP